MAVPDRIRSVSLARGGLSTQLRGASPDRVPRLVRRGVHPWLDDAVAGIGLAPEFQPVVSLANARPVGFEALSRWPALGNPDPQAVFAYAAATGRLAELDRRCVDSVISAALRDQLPRGALLFVNCEPASGYVSRADNAVLARAHDELQLVFEFTERGLLTHPRALLAKVAALRSDGFALAIDDVGAHPDSLALLDVIAPDVIKLDRQLVQNPTTYDQARILAAVLAHHERTGAVILAEGIETVAHLEQAQAIGATLGQGFLFGAPGPLNTHHQVRWPPPIESRGTARPPGTPFELVAASVPVRTARKETLLAYSRQIETLARYAPDAPMVLTALQRAEHFTAATRRRYQQLATSLPIVGIFGQDLSTDLGAGIRVTSLDPTDPLCAEWVVLVLGAQAAFALIARERDDIDQRFDFAITYDRSVVTAAARSLLGRMS